MVLDGLSNMATALRFHALKAQCVIAAGGVDVTDLLSGDGAAGDGGALSEVNRQVKEYGRGGFTIMQNVVIYGVAIALLAAAFLLAIHAGNPNKRDEQKSAIIWIVFAGVLGFAGVSVLVFAQKIGTALFG